MAMPADLQALSRGSNIVLVGTGCRLSRADLEKPFSKMQVATVSFARSIISSTILLVSRVTYIPTSRGSCVSRSISNLTSGEASVRAPRSTLFCLSFLVTFLRSSRLVVMTSVPPRSILSWASWYVRAALEWMTLLKNSGSPTTWAVSTLTLHSTLKANLSTLHRSEQMSSVKGLGSMSILRSTRYTLVHLLEASKSIGVFGLRKWVTSAMWTPSSTNFLSAASETQVTSPLSSTSEGETNLALRASSMSRHPGGSTLKTHIDLMSRRQESSMVEGTLQGSSGTQACTAGEKPSSGSATSCWWRITFVSVSLSPIIPSALT
mmetsp:Transcript_14317/g.40698  ORF Transcript_14317/g.40698 Transcript_14317/m.40698 type:complete len:321 (+) Transcript_14317:871-1833(+)